MRTHRFSLVTEGIDLLDWATLDTLYEAGCGDATVSHNLLEFDRVAPTGEEALQTAWKAAESIPGLRVLHAEFETPATDGACPPMMSPAAHARTRSGREIPRCAPKARRWG